MNPIFMASIMAGARAAQNRGKVPSYTPPRKKTKIKWDIGKDRFDSVQEYGHKIGRGIKNLAMGEKVTATQVEVENINPKKIHYNRTKILGAAALVGLACCTGLAGGALIAAGVVTGASAIGSVVEGIKGKKSSTKGEKRTEIRQADLMIQRDEKENRDKLVYVEKWGPNGPSQNSGRNPTFITWTSND